jgi:hypothetical protein
MIFRKLRRKVRVGIKTSIRAHILWSYSALGRANEDYRVVRERLQSEFPEMPISHGFKVYSQCDEDGIIEHIFAKLAVKHPTFFECGCGSGVENNTHYLLLKGGRGVWKDASAPAIDMIRQGLGGLDFPGHLRVECGMITPGGIVADLDAACRFVGVDALDFVSIDIDSYDADIAEAIMASAHRPKVLCMEYIAKWPPNFATRARHLPKGWRGDDYVGASLLTFVHILSASYELVSCSASGANAFFVRRDLSEAFPKYSLSELYQPARSHLIHVTPGHAPSLKYLRDVLSGSVL